MTILPKPWSWRMKRCLYWIQDRLFLRTWTRSQRKDFTALLQGIHSCATYPSLGNKETLQEQACVARNPRYPWRKYEKMGNTYMSVHQRKHAVRVLCSSGSVSKLMLFYITLWSLCWSWYGPLTIPNIPWPAKSLEVPVHLYYILCTLVYTAAMNVYNVLTE